MINGLMIGDRGSHFANIIFYPIHFKESNNFEVPNTGIQ